MTTGTPSKVAPDDQTCAQALRTLLDTAFSLEDVQRQTKPRTELYKLVPVGEIDWTPSTDTEDLIADPITEAMNHAVREIGQYLHATGGDERLQRVGDLACEPASRQWGRRMSRVNAVWDGIGDWHA
jgi:hypothetical protein